MKQDNGHYAVQVNSFKVTDFGTNRKPIWTANTNLHPILNRFKLLRIIGHIFPFDRGTSL